LTGSITDPSLAAVPDASVELVNAETGVQRSARSNAEGVYRFNHVAAGRYTLRAQAPGFARSDIGGLVVDAGRAQTLNVTLEVQSASAVIEITDTPAPIDTTTPNLQSIYTTRQAEGIPLSGIGTSGVLNLSLLSPGVSSSGGIGYGTGPSVGGQRPTNNNFMIEGVDINHRASTGPILNVSNEVVSELSIQQNQFSPEFGHSSGGQFNTLLKSGTNDLHGSLYEYFQNKNLNAMDESFRRQGVQSLPRFDQNRFGGTIGGPVLRNKLFYFGALEYQAQGRVATSAGAVYTPTAEGIRQLDAMNGISTANWSALKSYLPVAPFAARTVSVLGQTVPVGIPNTVGPSYTNDMRAVGSADYTLSNGDQLRGRWILHRGDSIENTPALPVFYTPIRSRNQVATVSHVHSFSASATNELRLGYTRAVESRPASDAIFPGLDAFPNLQFDDLGLNVGPHQAYPQSNRSNLLQLSENVNWIRGRHAFKFGYDARKVNSSNFFVFRQRGEYMYSTLERYLVDLTPEFASRSVGGFPFVGNLVSQYAHVSHEFRVRPNLTVTSGLRYEFVDVPVGAKHQALNEVSSVPGVLEFRAPKPSYRDFGPRVGVAWSPGTSGRTAIRAGFGMASDQNYHNMWMNSLPPQFFTTVDAHVERPSQPNFISGGAISGAPAPITDAASARRLTSAWIPDQQRPYSIQWNGGVQRSIAKDYTVEVRYLGTRGVHLPMQVQINRAAGATALMGLPTFLEWPSQATLDALPLTLDNLRATNTLAAPGFGRTITSYMPRGNSTYHGLATSVVRRFQSGLQFVGAYTWSHNIDDSTATVASTVLTPRRPQDFFNLRPERADSALDRRHRLTAGWTYELPKFARGGTAWAQHLLNDWALSGTYTAETGAWATVRSGVDSNVNGDPVGDRTIINIAGDPSRSSAVRALLNSSGKTVGYLAADPGARYVQAGAGAFPNAARNTLRLPGINNFDLSLRKELRLMERWSAQVGVEAYNALNHAQFVPGFTSSVDVRPRVTAGPTSLLVAGNPMFNRPDLAFESNARVVQLVARIRF
jgi:hypothetical protein